MGTLNVNVSCGQVKLHVLWHSQTASSSTRAQTFMCVCVDNWDSFDSPVAWAHEDPTQLTLIHPRHHLVKWYCISTVRPYMKTSAVSAKAFGRNAVGWRNKLRKVKRVFSLDVGLTVCVLSTDQPTFSSHFRENLSTWEWKWKSLEGSDSGPHIQFGNGGRGVWGCGGWTRDDLWDTD